MRAHLPSFLHSLSEAREKSVIVSIRWAFSLSFPRSGSRLNGIEVSRAWTRRKMRNRRLGLKIRRITYARRASAAAVCTVSPTRVEEFPLLSPCTWRNVARSLPPNNNSGAPIRIARLPFWRQVSSLHGKGRGRLWCAAFF